ncbi:MAG: hypothetical protein WC544_02860 [Patescibacteria group bacterium]
METRMSEGAHVEGMAEQENYSSRVLLHFFRHEEKGKDPDKTNEEQLLTERGKLRALAKGKSGRAALTSVAFGSDLPRAQETAGFVLAGANGAPDVTGTESLDELRAKLDKEREMGTVIGSDPRLGFTYNDPKYREIADGAYDESHGLEYMARESDALAEELHDKKSTTYSRAAGNVASVLEKYMRVGRNYDKLIQDPSKKDEYGSVLERFLGSHMGVVDLFLTKLVDKVKGTAEQDKLIAALNKQGFSYQEGFDVVIDTIPGQDEPLVRLKYEKKDDEGKELFSFNEVIPKDILRQLIEEGKIKE